MGVDFQKNVRTDKVTKLPIYKGVSASNFKNAPLCERRWAAKHIFRLIEPSNIYLAFGNAVHDVLRKWYRDGVRPTGANVAERCVLGMWSYIPPRELVWSNDGLCETDADLNAGDFMVRGPLDLAFRDPNDPDLAHCYDWKTIGKVARKLSADKLREDPQMIVYAIAVCARFKVSRVRMHWVYGQRKAEADGTHPARPTEIEITLADARAAWSDKWEPIARRLIAHHIHAIEVGATLADYEFDKKACWMYGEICPYAVECTLANEKREQPMSSETSTLWDDLFGEDDAAPTPPADDPINPPESPKKTGKAIAAETRPEPAPEPAPEPEKKKRKPGRPKGSKDAPAEKSPRGFDLFLFCTPIKGVEVTYLADAMRHVMDSVESEHGVLHWRTIKYGGKAEMAAACRAAILRGDFDGMSICAPVYDDLADACMAEITAAAGVIISGVR